MAVGIDGGGRGLATPRRPCSADAALIAGERRLDYGERVVAAEKMTPPRRRAQR